MPDIKVVDASVLQDQSGIQGKGQSLGAYSKENDTIYISEQLLQSDPDKALQILTEELGHGLDSRLNTSDAAYISRHIPRYIGSIKGNALLATS